jgi:hypothetical protein
MANPSLLSVESKRDPEPLAGRRLRRRAMLF